jgi:transcription-repair coupling factor (superfamily II helicase)
LPGRTLFAVESEGRREGLGDLLARINLQPREFASSTPSSRAMRATGCWSVPGAGLPAARARPDAPCLITEAELLGGKIRSKRQRDEQDLSSDAVIRNLGELTQGQPVVHWITGSVAIWGSRP